MVIQDSVITASRPPATDSRAIRVRSRTSAAIRYTTASTGRAMNPSSIFVLNASPNATALRISQSSGCPLPARPARSDSSSAQAPNASSSVSIVSGLSSLSIATTTGVRVRASAAISRPPLCCRRSPPARPGPAPPRPGGAPSTRPPASLGQNRAGRWVGLGRVGHRSAGPVEAGQLHHHHQHAGGDEAEKAGYEVAGPVGREGAEDYQSHRATGGHGDPRARHYAGGDPPFQPSPNARRGRVAGAVKRAVKDSGLARSLSHQGGELARGVRLVDLAFCRLRVGIGDDEAAFVPADADRIDQRVALDPRLRGFAGRGSSRWFARSHRSRKPCRPATGRRRWGTGTASPRRPFDLPVRQNADELVLRTGDDPQAVLRIDAHAARGRNFRELLRRAARGGELPIQLVSRSATKMLPFASTAIDMGMPMPAWAPLMRGVSLPGPSTR